jgi:nuclear transport factor 2 (NTF2) superfamily protein
MNPRPPLPPFTDETALQKIQAAENAWDPLDSERIALACTEDTEWCNRAEFINGRAQVVKFLQRNGKRNWITGSKKNCGAFAITAWPRVLNMNGMTVPANGFVPTATNYGNLTNSVT